MAATNRHGLTNVQQQALEAGREHADKTYPERNDVRVKLYDNDPYLEVPHAKGFSVEGVPTWDIK